MTKLFLSPKDLAERWRVSVAMLYKLARNGELPAMRIGKTVRFKAADVDAYERSQSQEN